MHIDRQEAKNWKKEHEGCSCYDASDISRDARAHEAAMQRESPRAKADCSFKSTAATTDQIVAGFGLSLASFVSRDVACSGHQGASGDFRLRKRRAARELFDGVAVEVAGSKIHVCENAVCAQYFVNGTHHFEKGGPIDVRDQTHAGNDIADRDVGSTLK